MRLLVVEDDPDLNRQLTTALSDAGYEVSTDYLEGMKSVLAFNPDAVVLGADPPQLDCCDLLSEIKGSEKTQNVRVIMLSPGGSAERTRGLERTADAVGHADCIQTPEAILQCHRHAQSHSFEAGYQRAMIQFVSLPARFQPLFMNQP